MSNEIRVLAMAFRSDSYHNLVLAEAGKSHLLYTREPVRAKVLVLLHMSIECALKCMITIERQNKDFAHIYKIIRKCGHDLSKLSSAITSTALDPRLRSRLKAFNPAGVNLRYGFEVMLLRVDQLFTPGENPEFSDAKLDEAFDLAKFIWELTTGIYKTTYTSAFTWANGDNPTRVINRIKSLGSMKR